MTRNENRYLAFLAFSPHDNRGQHPGTEDVIHRCWADWLHDALKTFSVPAEFVGQINGRGENIPERINLIFRDDQELVGDAILPEDIRKALEQSICLIVICSPRSAQDLRVNEAVRYFKQLGRGKNILPIVMAGEPNVSFGNESVMSPAEECFVPALRHPVQQDGTLDLSRRAGRHIYVDARHGAEKREILANDHRTADADLEMAKIHLIALLLGVGFNGLWWREQKRHFHDFAEAQLQVRNALERVKEVQCQLQAAQAQTREAQKQVLEIQNLPLDVHGQILEVQNQALEAGNQARVAREQLQELQNKLRDTQTRLEEACERARVAENKVLEAQYLAREVQSQLEEVRNQAREVQQAQTPIAETHNQTQDVQNKFLEAQSQIQELQNQARSAAVLLDEARNRSLAAEGKVLEAQHQVRETHNQLEAARNHIRETQNTQSQLEETRQQARDVQDKFAEAQSQLEKARYQVREAEGKIMELQAQARDAQSQIQETQNRAQDDDRNAQAQIRTAQIQIQETQIKSRNARRLTKALALLAVLALLAAGVAARESLRQRQTNSKAMARATAEAAGNFDLTAGVLDQQKIQQILGNIGGAEQIETRQRSLDRLAASIPWVEIPEALKSASVISDDQQRSHFQKWLLIRQSWVNPGSAMTNASAFQGRIENDDGLSDSTIYFQLAVLENWMKADLPGAFNWVCQLPDADSRSRALEKIIPAMTADDPENTLARLNDLQPAPDERIYQLLFQHWAERDPRTAARFAQGHFGYSTGDALAEIIQAWLQGGWSDLLQMLSHRDGLTEIMQSGKAESSRSRFLPNSDFSSPTAFPVETEVFSNTTNEPDSIKLEK